MLFATARILYLERRTVQFSLLKHDLLGRSAVQSTLFQYEWLCWDGAQFSLFFFNMTTVKLLGGQHDSAEFGKWNGERLGLLSEMRLGSLGTVQSFLVRCK